MAEYGAPISQHYANPYSGSGGLNIELTGEGWITLNNVLTYFADAGGRALKRDVAKAARDFALRYKKLLILGHMTEGAAVGAVWPPHSDNYKSPTGYLLHRSGAYQEALQNLEIKQEWYNISMTFRKGDLNRTSSVKDGLTLGQYSVIHEFGSSARFIPPRPLWGPAYKKMGGDVGLTERVRGAIGKRFKKMGAL